MGHSKCLRLFCFLYVCIKDKNIEFLFAYKDFRVVAYCSGKCAVCVCVCVCVCARARARACMPVCCVSVEDIFL